MLRKFRRTIRSFHTAWTRAEDSEEEPQSDSATGSRSRPTLVHRERGGTLLNTDDKETDIYGVSRDDAEVSSAKADSPLTSHSTVAPTSPDPHTRLCPLREDAAIQPTKEDAAIQPTKEDAAIQPTKEDAAVKPTKEDAAIQPPKQDAAIKPNKQDAAIQSNNQDAAIRPNKQDVAIQSNNQDAAIKPNKQDAAMQLNNQDAAIQPNKQDAAMQSNNQDAAIKPNKQDAAIQPNKQDAAIQLNNQDAAIKPNKQDAAIQPNKQDAAIKLTKQDATIQPTKKDAAIQLTKQDATIKPNNQDAAMQPNNQDAAIKATKQDATIKTNNQDTAIQPNKQDAAIQPNNQDAAIQTDQENAVSNSRIHPPGQDVGIQTVYDVDVTSSCTSDSMLCRPTHQPSLDETSLNESLRISQESTTPRRVPSPREVRCLHNQEGQLCTVQGRRYVFTQVDGAPLLVCVNEPGENQGAYGLVWKNHILPTLISHVPDGTRVFVDAVAATDSPKLTAVLLWLDKKPQQLCLPADKTSKYFLGGIMVRGATLVSSSKKTGVMSVVIDSKQIQVKFSYNDTFMAQQKVTQNNVSKLFSSTSLVNAVLLKFLHINTGDTHYIPVCVWNGQLPRELPNLMPGKLYTWSACTNFTEKNCHSARIDVLCDVLNTESKAELIPLDGSGSVDLGRWASLWKLPGQVCYAASRVRVRAHLLTQATKGTQSPVTKVIMLHQIPETDETPDTDLALKLDPNLVSGEALQTEMNLTTDDDAPEMGLAADDFQEEGEDVGLMMNSQTDEVLSVNETPENDQTPNLDTSQEIIYTQDTLEINAIPPIKETLEIDETKEDEKRADVDKYSMIENEQETKYNPQEAQVSQTVVGKSSTGRPLNTSSSDPSLPTNSKKENIPRNSNLILPQWFYNRPWSFGVPVPTTTRHSELKSTVNGLSASSDKLSGHDISPSGRKTAVMDDTPETTDPGNSGLILAEDCIWVAAGISQGVVKKSDKYILVKHSDLFIDGKKCPSDTPLAMFPFRGQFLQAIIELLSKPKQKFSYSVTHKAVVAWEGPRPCSDEFVEDQQQEEQITRTFIAEDDTAQQPTQPEPDFMFSSPKVTENTENNIENSACNAVSASISQAVVSSRSKTVIVKHKRFFVNQARIPSNEPLVKYINNNIQVNVITVKLARPQYVLGHKATHEALVAWQGKKPPEANQMVENYRQNKKLVPEARTLSLSVDVKQPKSGSSSSTSIQKTEKVKKLNNIPGNIIELNKDFGIIECGNKQNKSTLAVFSPDVAYLNQQKLTKKQWRQWQDLQSKYKQWYCDLEHRPSKRGTFDVQYKVKLMWLDKKPAGPHNQKESEPLADARGQKTESKRLSKEKNQESQGCKCCWSGSTQSVSFTEASNTDLQEQIIKEVPGVVLEVQAMMGRVRTSSGHYYFTHQQCLLYGVALYHVPLHQVLRLGMAASCELRKGLKGEWNISRVWVGGRRPADPCVGYALLRQLCRRNGVSHSTLDLLVKRAGYEGGSGDDSESSAEDDACWHHHLFPTAAATDDKDTVHLTAQPPY